MPRKKEEFEWKIEKRLRKWLANTTITILIFFVKIILIVLGILFLIYALNLQDFVLFVIDVSKQTGEFVLSKTFNVTSSD